LHQSCGSGDCAADETVLTDYDADCVADESDNCVLAEDPAGGYNPEQFDGDEDGVGYPCDTNDGDATGTGVSLIDGPSFNMAGSYRFDGDCPGFLTATVAQNSDRVRLTDDSGRTFDGEASLEADGVTMTATLSNANGATCVFSADAVTFVSAIACSNGPDAACRGEGLKTGTSLWSEWDRDESSL
jgi:hypothetical protein